MDRSNKCTPNPKRACLCDDATYSRKCCKEGAQGIGRVTGVKISKGGFSNGFSNGFELK